MGYTGEKKREYQNRWLTARRQKWLKDNGPCATCGSWEKLEVDHIDPATKLINPRGLWGMSDKNPRKIAELAKCQALCYGCHFEKTRSELIQRVCIYGHDKGQVGGRCKECKKLRMRELRARQRTRG